MRDQNTALVLHLAWEAEEISRIDLARQSGLAPSTVSSIVGELVELGLLRESHARRTAGGRPPIVLSFDEDRYQLIGIDLGATHVSVALTNLRGKVLSWQTQRHPVQTDPSGALRLAIDLVHGALADADCILEAVVGAGLSVPSPIDSEEPDHLSERILPAWADVRPGAWLETALGLPVLVENDANACALAESWLGSGRGFETLAFIKLGTGVGAGLVVDGELMRGANGFAGEIGHTAIDSSGPPCACGLHGCLQAMVGSAAVLDHVRGLLESGRSSVLSGAAELSLGAVARAAADGDELAIEAVEAASHALGIAIANLFNLINPSLVLLGGSLTAAGDRLLQPLREAIRERALWASLARAEVAIGELGERTAAMGAATLVLRSALADPTMFTNQTGTLAS